MSDNKIYYYMRLKDNFFDDDNLKIIEGIPNEGYKYSNILLKLYLRSLKTEGRLMINNTIPYNLTMIASITGHSESTCKCALELFQQLGLIEILDNGAIYMMNIQEYIGQSSTEADRIKAYRHRVSEEKKLLDGGGVQMYDKCTPKIEIDIDIEKEIERKKNATHSKKEKSDDTFVKPTVDEVRAYCTERNNGIDAQTFIDFYDSKKWKVGKNTPMQDWRAAVRTWENRRKNKPTTYGNTIKAISDADRERWINEQERTE